MIDFVWRKVVGSLGSLIKEEGPREAKEKGPCVN